MPEREQDSSNVGSPQPKAPSPKVARSTLGSTSGLSFLDKLRSVWRRWAARASGAAPALNGLFLAAPHPVLVQRGGIVVAANAPAARLYGYDDPQDMAGWNLRELCADEPAHRQFEERQAQADALPVGGQLAEIDYHLRDRLGRQRFVSVVTIKDRWQGREALFSHFTDRTENVLTQQALQESEALMTGVFEVSPFAISISDPATGRLHRVNDAYCRMVGHERHRLIGRTTHEIGLWPQGIEQRDRVIASNGTPGQHAPVFFNEWLRRGDGIDIYTSGATTYVGDPARPMVLFIGTDVTQSVREQAQLRAIMDHGPGCIVVTAGPVIRSASPSLRDLAGRPDLQPVGMHVASLWADAQVYAEIERDSLAQMRQRGRVDMVRPHRRPDGRIIQLRVQGNPLQLEGESQATRSFVWILSDITAEMEAFRAREVAETASRAKTDFLATMSHELRTPLNGVLGLAELARARDTKAAERKEYLNQLADCAHSLADILNDILDLSKIEAGRMELEPRAMDLPEFFERLRATYTSLAEARGLQFRTHLEPELPRTVMADATRLRQIVANFLGNALKFTTEGHIRLAVSSPQPGRLLIEVEDTGPGIADDLLPRLFSPFEQARNTHRNRPAGTGLGLAICRQLARLMGGEVGVSSRTGQGSRFWMDVPLKRPDALSLAQSLSEQRGRDLKLTGVRVLLAEDNEVNALITMRALNSAGAEALRVADGQAAVEAVEAAYADGEPYNVVLMDVQMPVMDGLQATRQIRLRACGEGLRIVALTAGALAEQREECRQAGMDAHLLKPLHRDRLLHEVLLQATLGTRTAATAQAAAGEQTNLSF